MSTVVSVIIFAAAVLFVATVLYRRLGRTPSHPSRTTGRTNASDAGDTSMPLWFAAGGHHSDSGGHSGGYSGGDSGGGDGGGGGGGE